MRNAPTPQRGRASSSPKQPPSATKAKATLMSRVFGRQNKSRHGKPSRKRCMLKAEKLWCSFGTLAASLTPAFNPMVRLPSHLRPLLQSQKPFSLKMVFQALSLPLRHVRSNWLKCRASLPTTDGRQKTPSMRALMASKCMRPMAT